MKETIHFAIKPFCHLTKGWSYYRKGTTVGLFISLDKTHVYIIQDTNCILDHCEFQSL